ncbi:MAG TPA: hypothetical protein PLX35_16755 [Cyclobacteriaceae bacterium]|nr:hypothetical protein [Cyclobacteriaceae bacterium]
MSNLTCKLTTPEFRARKATIIAELKSLSVGREEMENGYRYTFSGSDEILDLLTSFIKSERNCCDFFSYRLTVGEPMGHTYLDLIGPEGVKQFIKEHIEL